MGNLFVATLDTATSFDDRGRILKFAADGTVTPFATGLETPSGLAFDGAGNLYVASGNPGHAGLGNGGTGRLMKVTPAGVMSLFAILDPATFHQNFGIALDERHNFFVADNLQGTVYKITRDRPSGPAREISTFVSIPDPIGLAFDQVGNLYAADSDASIGPGASLKSLPMEQRLSSFLDWVTFVDWLSISPAIF
jgi:sugar lactone lactonase YvrE